MEVDMTETTASRSELNDNNKISTDPCAPAVDCSAYQYLPLSTNASIRVIELLPGLPDTPVQVTILHCLLSDLPAYSAVSYVWGCPDRVKHVLCEGKIVKVTSSALLLLQKLRHKNESLWLWIDGICINQDNLAERAQQVPLMRDIYQMVKQVLIWIGDETEHTEKTFEVAREIAKTHDTVTSTKKVTFEKFRQFQTVADLPEFAELENLTKEPVWEGISDVFSRDYFNRLWTVQEVVLAPKAFVICGHHALDWDAYFKAALCVWCCHFLQVWGLDINIICEIKLTGLMKSRDSYRPLPLLLTYFSHRTACEPRDRLYALLGMLPRGAEDELLEVDYTKPVGKVFTDATKYLIKNEQNLYHWTHLNYEPRIRSDYELPSWVDTFSVKVFRARFDAERVPMLIQTLTLNDKTMEIDGDTLLVYGIIIDTVKTTFPNFSGDNFKFLILDVFEQCYSLQGKTDVSDSDKLSNAISTTLKMIHPHQESHLFDENGFFCLICCWILSDIGLLPQTVEQNPKIKDLAEAYPKLKVAYPEEIEKDMSIQEVVAQDKALQWMLEQIEIGFESAALYEQHLQYQLYDRNLKVGRSLFVSQRGYVGLGPVGKIGKGGSDAAVQRGDFLVLVCTAPSPMVFRRYDDETYTVVGACHVGNLGDVQSPIIKDGKLPEPVALRVR